MLESIFKHFKKVLKMLSSTNTEVLAPCMSAATTNKSQTSSLG